MPKVDQPNVDEAPSDAPTSKEDQKQQPIARPADPVVQEVAWLPVQSANVDEKPSFTSNLMHSPPPIKPKPQIPKEDQTYVDGEPSVAPTSKDAQKQPSIARPQSIAEVLQ